MVVFAYNYTSDVIDNESFVGCPKEQDAIRRLVQRAFICLDRFYKTLTVLASFTLIEPGLVICQLDLHERE